VLAGSVPKDKLTSSVIGTSHVIVLTNVLGASAGWVCLSEQNKAYNCWHQNMLGVPCWNGYLLPVYNGSLVLC